MNHAWIVRGGIAALSVLAARAGTVEEPKTNLPPIVVEASRAGKTAAEMPAEVQVITAKEIAESGCHSTAELLEKRANLLVRKMNSNPGFAQVAMRGFGENSFGRVLILVDGERLNNPDMSAPNLTRIPLDSIKRLEIIHGPQTVLHGDEASAGVINVITADRDSYEPKTTVGGAVGSWDTYKAHVAREGGFRDEGVTYRANTDWEKSNGWRENGGYQIWNAGGGATKHWERGDRLSVSAFYNWSDYDMPGSLTRDQWRRDHSPREAQTPDNTARLYSYGANLGGTGHFTDDRWLEANLTASRRSTYWDNVSWKSTLDYDVDQYAFTPRYVDKSDLFGHENRFIVGTDLRYETLDYLSKSHAYGRSRTDKDYDRFASAVYAQDEWFVTDELSVTLGARGERLHSRWSPDQNGRGNWVDWEGAYEAALTYRPVEELKVFGRGSRFYRAPFCDEMNYAPEALDPETGYGAEAGAEWAFAREWAAGVTGYAMWMKDELFYDPGRYYNYWWGANVNSPYDTTRSGADAKVEWSRERVANAGVYYSYTDARFAEGPYDNEQVPLVPHQLVRVRGEVYIVDDLSVFGGARYVSRQGLAGDYGGAEPELKAYGLLDAGARYVPSFGPFGGRLTVQLAVDNLLDKKYCDFAGATKQYDGSFSDYYYPAAGRCWMLSASYEF
jgi:iron complex outermembrane receptor protein